MTQWFNHSNYAIDKTAHTSPSSLLVFETGGAHMTLPSGLDKANKDDRKRSAPFIRLIPAVHLSPVRSPRFLPRIAWRSLREVEHECLLSRPLSLLRSGAQSLSWHDRWTL